MYVKKGKWLFVALTLAMVLMLLPAMGAAGGNNACGDCEPYFETKLYAGQTIDVGKVIVTNTEDQLCIRYELSESALEDGWLIYETHWAVGKNLSDIPQTRGNRWGTNPIPGLFPYGGEKLEGVEYYEECIDFPNDWIWCDELYIAAHAVIERTNYNETAWGKGERFNERGNWGMWFNYTICEPVELFELTFFIIGDGQATGEGFYAAGEVVEIEAIPDSGNLFQLWSAPAGTFGSEFAASTTFTMPSQDVTVTARFMPEEEFEDRDRDHTDLCVDQTGGVGIIVDTWDISEVADGTVFDFYFHALTQPDRWTIWYDGNVVFSSGWVSSEPDRWSVEPLFAAEGVQHHYWHPNVVATTWRTWSGGTHPEGGLYVGIITKQAGIDEIVIRTEGGEPGTLWYYQLCTQ